jgi:hypothetical protein
MRAGTRTAPLRQRLALWSARANGRRGGTRCGPEGVVDEPFVAFRPGTGMRRIADVLARTAARLGGVPGRRARALTERP